MILLNIINIILCEQSLHRSYAKLMAIVCYISSRDLYFADASITKSLIPSQKLLGLFLGISQNLFLRISILPPFCSSNYMYFSISLNILCVSLSALQPMRLLIDQNESYVRKDQIIKDLNQELSNSLADSLKYTFKLLASFQA